VVSGSLEKGNRRRGGKETEGGKQMTAGRAKTDERSECVMRRAIDQCPCSGVRGIKDGRERERRQEFEKNKVRN
jgi:hypothetical protein